MAFEIELKARVAEDDVDRVKAILDDSYWSESLGKIDKDDIYWGNEGKAAFRTRHETDSQGTSILLTVKPSQISQDGIENNIEIEYRAFDDWEKCLEFQKALGYEIVRHKYKTGWHYNVCLNSLEIHAELLFVKYLGWFLEMEYCPESLSDKTQINKAEETLKLILSKCNIKESQIEPQSYTKMLTACNHLLG